MFITIAVISQQSTVDSSCYMFGRNVELFRITYQGEAIEIAFNPTFLTDGLSALGTTYVNIAFTGSNKPAMLSGKNKINGETDSSYRYLLMPMRYAS